MRCNLLYFFILGLLVIACFSHSNFTMKQVSTPKAPLLTLPIVTDLSSLGMTIEGSNIDGNCNLERINDRNFDTAIQAVNKDSILKMAGWALDVKNSRLPLSIAIRFTDLENKDYFAPAQIGLSRPDVQSHFSLDKKLLYSGFQLQNTLQVIPEGEYRVTLIMNFEDSVYSCDNSKTVSIQ